MIEHVYLYLAIILGLVGTVVVFACGYALGSHSERLKVEDITPEPLSQVKPRRAK